MLRTLFVIWIFLSYISIYSQPNKISYQGVLTDNSGALLNGTKNLTFKVYDALTAGNLLATDVHNGVSVTNGLFTVELNIGSLNFSQNLWLEITVESTILTPRIAFNARGYAISVNEKDSRVPLGNQVGQMQYWNRTAWVSIVKCQKGQFLRLLNSTPTWVSVSEIDFLEIGDYYQGGIIAYFFQSGAPVYDSNALFGLISAQSNQSTLAEWGCIGTTSEHSSFGAKNMDFNDGNETSTNKNFATYVNAVRLF